MSIRNALASMALAIGPSLLCSGCGSADETDGPTSTRTQQLIDTPGGRPASVPDNYVATPHGFFDPSCVIHMQADEHVDQAGGGLRIARLDGRVRSLNKCGHPHFDRAGREVVAKNPPPKAAPPPQIDTWVISPSNSSQGAVRSLSASFTVPPAPTVQTGQTLYYFPGLEPPTGNTILQPVLGWNHFGDGNRWAMASWNCCVEGNITHSDIVPVSPGNVLNGTMTGTNCNAAGVCANWRIDTVNTANNQLVRLDTTAYGQTLEWIFGGVLEAYQLTECGQLPPSNFIQFNNVNTSTVSGGAVTFPWFFNAPVGLDPDCNYNAVTSATNVKLTWSAPQPLVALPRSGWVATASSTSGADVPARALDGNPATRFSTGVPQSSATKQWFQVDMLTPKTFRRVVIDSPGNDYARNFEAYSSPDGLTWTWAGGGATSLAGPTTINFASVTARYVRVEITTAPGVGAWWSISELNVWGEGTVQPPPGQALSRSGWVTTASATGGSDVASRAIDGSTSTRWSSGSPQSNAATRSFTIDMLSQRTFAKISLESSGDYARNYQVFASNDGTNWGSAFASGTGTGATTTITFAQRTARYLQIRQTTSAGTGAWWSIQELNVYSP